MQTEDNITGKRCYLRLVVMHLRFCYNLSIKAIPHKDCVRIAQSDFSSACIKTTQEYFVVFKANDRFALNIVCLGVLVQDDGKYASKAYTKP